MALALLAALYTPVCAAELGTVTAGMALETGADTGMHGDASETSDVIAVLEAGTVVVTAGDAEDGWCMVSAGGSTGYVRTESLKTVGDRAELDAEFERIASSGRMLFNEVQQAGRRKSQTRMWGTAMALLTAGVFAAGMVSAAGKDREDGDSGTKKRRTRGRD